ncbi:cupin domain-containing protein [Methylobacterium planeticum]|uniref:Cupin domain-containing protein n=1 Tax=Methylobacterium planeticum TaxID=2615211 RepID=A0A6N6MU01_9HYPH|nr:cupin domain-containing protein [Methylobacterium planeticum]KAB1074901.1 cupin domain-containing protein [Methylobacterium planeticum]
MATKISSRTASAGAHGEVSLAGGETLAMRMWRDEPPTDQKPSASRPYETVGYVISGRAELTLSGETVTLEPGDSWLVPAGAEHSYRILETFTAVEATAPPAS